MASLFRESDSFTVCFRVGKKQYRRSLKTTNEREAKARQGCIEGTLWDIAKGKLVIPDGADVGDFVLSDGRMTGKLVLPEHHTLEQMINMYLDSRNNLEPSTMQSMRIHAKHMLNSESLGKGRIFCTISHLDLQNYVNERVSKGTKSKKKKVISKTVSGTTAGKELKTFRSVWLWAKKTKLIHQDLPDLDLEYPKIKNKPEFQTWSQIERIVKRGGLSDDAINELWNFLWLDVDQTNELLTYVKEHATHPFIYPMMLMIAHTGCRRSEMLRSKQTDFDFEEGFVAIREKKKKKEFELTIRKVALSPLLAKVMKDYFFEQSGEFSIADEQGKGLTKHQASHYLKRTLAGSKWKVLRGFHVLRHSFISNFARKGIDQRILDGFVGHTTDAMREHYRHLHPQQLGDAIGKVFAA